MVRARRVSYSAVELAALVEQHRLRGVQVLRLPGIDDAAAEGDDAAARIADREHDAVAEAVVVALSALRVPALALDDEAGIGESLARGLGGTEAPQHLVPGVRRVADLEALESLWGKSAARHVGARPRIARQRFRVEARDLLDQVVEGVIRAPRGVVAAALVRHLEPEARRQLLHRLGEGHVVVVHEEPERPCRARRSRSSDRTACRG